MGLATAFASGSLDALAVEDTVRRGGEAALTKAVSTLLTFQCAGLACGALACGFLPYIKGYALHLLLKCFIYLTVALTVAFLPHETRKDANESGSSLRLHLNNMIGLLRGSSMLKSIAICIVFAAIVQGALETYWQPQLSSIMTDGSQTVLGILAAAAYLTTTVGCVLFGRINLDSPKRSWTLYLGISAGIAVLTAVLSLAADAAAFSLIYIILYLAIGMLSVLEQAIINREVSDDVRASMLSVTSFAARIGLMFSGVICSFLISGESISFVWRITALIAAFGFALVSAARIFARGFSHSKDFSEHIDV
jgi:predicted MFS family arabinose efflux permease